MEQIIRIGMDTSKHVFQCMASTLLQPILRKKLRRKEMMGFFSRNARRL